MVKLIDHRFVGHGNMALVMERLEGPDLYDYINSQESAMDEDIAHCLFKQVLLVVIECHKHGIVHRDIKDENIMFDHTNHLKLIDFGGATFPITPRMVRLPRLLVRSSLHHLNGFHNARTKPNRTQCGNLDLRCLACYVATYHSNRPTK